MINADLIAAAVAILGVALLLAAPLGFRHEFAKDPTGPASGFAQFVEVPVRRPQYGRFARGLMVAAMLFDSATWPARGGVR